jgi:lactoylglutathione lyase
MTVLLRAPLEVGVCVLDLERMAAFYQSVLGFAHVSDATLAADRAERAGFGPVSFRMRRLQTNRGERIKLLQPDPTPGPTPREPILARAGLAYLTFIVDDIDAAFERLVAAGAERITDGPVQTRPGTRLLFFRDPEGNVLELCEYEDLAAYRPDL